MTKKRKVLIATIVLLLVALVSWRTYEGQKQNFSTIKIGAILVMSGNYAVQGENSQKGIQLAVNDINERGGVLGRKIQVVYQDNPGDNPTTAISAFNGLIQQNIRLIIGPNLTPSSLALLPLVDPNDALLISPSVGDEKFGEGSKNTFDVWPPDRNTSFTLANYLYQKGIRKIAIFGSEQSWEQQQANYVKQKFQELGGTVTDFELPQVDNLDLRTEALRIKVSNPEAVVFTDYGETSYAARRLRSLGVAVPFYSVLLDENGIQNAQGALEGAVFVTSYTPTQTFIDKFQSSYGVAPQFPADTAYDAMEILAAAIQKAGTTNTADVVNALNGIKSWNGASGNFSFDSYGDAAKQPAMFIVKGTSTVPYSP